MVAEPNVILRAVPTAERSRRVSITRVEQDRPDQTTDTVAVERGLEVRVGGDAFAVIMRTPGSDGDLAAGFLLSEGVIATRDHIVQLVQAADDDVVEVTLTAVCTDALAERQARGRQVTMNSSCGLCGRPSLASLQVSAPVVDAALRVPATTVSQLPLLLRASQPTFDTTGGLHAAALVGLDGQLAASAEDVGRHNAVDKILGRLLMAGRLPLSDLMLVVSGRTSYEILQKAWIAGVPLVAAVSAPSSLAIELAEEAGITLIGFSRDGRFNIYAHPGRIATRP